MISKPRSCILCVSLGVSCLPSRQLPNEFHTAKSLLYMCLREPNIPAIAPELKELVLRAWLT